MGFFDDFGSGSSTPGVSWLPGLLGETLILVALYRFLFFGLLRKLCEQTFCKASWWPYLLTFNGLFCQDVQKEVVYMSILAVHHLLGGGLMLAGYVYDSPSMWLQGLLFEVVDDIHDSMLMLIPLWPFVETTDTSATLATTGRPTASSPDAAANSATQPASNRDPKLATLLCFHHSFGIITFIPVILTGLFLDSRVQAIGWSLLLAGGISCGVLAYSRTIDRNTPTGAWKSFIVWMCNLGFFYYCRFYVYPREFYSLVYTEWAQLETSTKIVLVVGNLLISVFNLAIGVDATFQAVGLLRNALRGGKPVKQE